MHGPPQTRAELGMMILAYIIVAVVAVPVIIGVLVIDGLDSIWRRRHCHNEKYY